MAGNVAYADGFISVGSTVLALPVPSGFVRGVALPYRLFLTVETAAIRFRYNGDNPAAGAGGGHLLNSGENVTLEGWQNIAKLRLIANTGTAANIFYTLESL